MTEAYLIFSVLSICFISVTAWALINTTKHRAVLVVIIPILVALGAYAYVTVDSVVGYPTDKPIPENSLYVSHIVNSDKTKIFIWAQSEERPRAYVIPYTKKDEEKLEESKGKQDAGIPQMIEGDTETPGDEFSDSTKGAIKLYDFEMTGGTSK
jgi:hypothetical protein